MWREEKKRRREAGKGGYLYSLVAVGLCTALENCERRSPKIRVLLSSRTFEELKDYATTMR